MNCAVLICWQYHHFAQSALIVISYFDAFFLKTLLDDKVTKESIDSLVAFVILFIKDGNKRFDDSKNFQVIFNNSKILLLIKAN